MVYRLGNRDQLGDPDGLIFFDFPNKIAVVWL